MTHILKKKWTLLEDVDESLITQFAHETRIPKPLSKILIRRHIDSKSAAKTYFVPDLNQLHDPFLMKGMAKAADRIIEVIKNKEKILIFGDYDVDGTSGVSMFHVFCRELGVPNVVYLPDRFTDGYGLSNTGIDHAVKNGIKLIVAIDCGITAVDRVDYARSQGVDIIICDHHQPPEKLPNAFAILDALQPDCQYPFKSLCGTGVAFKLIQAVCQKLDLDIHTELLDFVATATAADMVPVIGENRVLIHFGFHQIMEHPRPSFSAIIRNAGLKLENLSTSNVVFSIGPRINAVGRLGDATRAVEFLTCDDITKVDDLAEVLEQENTNRKKIDSEIYLQAQNSYEIYRNEDFANSKDVAIVLHNPEWHPGVLGIIASRMVEKYYRPSIILTTFNGNAKGSARSVSNFNIYDAIKRTSEECGAVVQFGGHFHAAGIEISADRIDEFRITFNRIAKDMIDGSTFGQDMLIPEIKIDTELDINEINHRFVKILKHFEPFGPGNMTPVFMTKNLQVIGEPRVYNNSTTVFKVRKSSPNGNGENKMFGYDSYVFDCVYYQSPGLGPEDRIKVKTGDKIDVVYSVEENHWNGNTKTQLRVRDIKLTQV